MGQSKRKGGSSNKKGSTEKATSGDTASPEQLKNESQHRTSSLMGKLRSEVKDIYQNDIDIIASNFHYKRRPTEGEITSSPMVVFLGNHSSGKSSFINHILGRDVQRSGVAPVDDGFTIIMHGENELDQSGPAVVANKNLPFCALGNLGDQMVNHLRLKLRPIPLLKNVTLVDSPGMIDSIHEGADRGYDFIQAVRWFAERADYVLIFFDPDKPGTTGESLQVFTQALTGIEHKLLILLNKVDAFQNICDFSRAYGALCWNLAKLIPFKDMPYIYTTFIPGKIEQSLSRKWSLEEFAKIRVEVIQKIHDAPSHHLDNMITELKKYTDGLIIHSQVLNRARSRLWYYRLQLWLLWLLAAGLIGGVAFYFTQDPLIAASSVFVFFIGLLVTYKMVHSKEHKLIRKLDHTFDELFEDVSEEQNDVRQMWEAIRPITETTAKRHGLLSFPSLTRRQRAKMASIVDERVPYLLNQVHTTLKKHS